MYSHILIFSLDLVINDTVRFLLEVLYFWMTMPEATPINMGVVRNVALDKFGQFENK